MTTTNDREDVEFPTQDGVILRGWIYPGPNHGPAVVMSPGFNCLKEMLLPEVAKTFQTAGFTVLAYDTRSVGASGGLPRNDISPQKQVEDYHDAVTYLKSHSLVDSKRIALWGYSVGAMVALSATALDPRVAAVIACAPPIDYGLPAEKRLSLLMQMQEDRELFLAGKPYLRIPLFDDEDGIRLRAAAPFPPDQRALMDKTQSFGEEKEAKTTLQTYYWAAMWDSSNLIPLVSPTPVLLCVAEEDSMVPLEDHRKLFEKFSEPKEFLCVPNTGHMDMLSPQTFASVMRVQINFLRKYLGAGRSSKATTKSVL